MQDIPDGSVDMICTDLPYGVLNSESEGGSWDAVIPFEPLWREYERVIKDNGAIVLFSQGLFTARLILSNEKLFRYTLVWNKGRATGFLNAYRMPLRYHEDICVFYKSLPTYNPQMEELNGREKNHPQGKGTHDDKNQCYGKVDRTYRSEPIDKKFPGSIINIRALHCDKDQWHPTQKPTDLIRYLIRTYSNEGDVVLDSCAGSGTTAIACIKEKRDFICIEKDEDYFKKAEKRIKIELSQPTLF